MTALTANRDDLRQDGDWLLYPVAASQTIYQGSAVSLNSTGFLIPSADTASTLYVGEALEGLNNSTGSNGTLPSSNGFTGAVNCIRVQLTGVYLFQFAGTATQATVGQKVYATDSQTVNATTTNSVYVGRVVRFLTASSVLVKINVP